VIIGDAQWQQLRVALLNMNGSHGPGFVGRDYRSFIEAMIFIAENKIKWRDLPPQLGEWHTVYMKFTRWNQLGNWRKLEGIIVGDEELKAMIQKIVVFGERRVVRKRK
jgi:transposase